MQTVFIIHSSGMSILQFTPVIHNGEEAFYGGDTHTEFKQWLVGGPHVILTAEAMLDLIGRLALEDEYPYTLRSDLFIDRGIRYGRELRLQPEMRADTLAEALGLDLKTVLDHYDFGELLVSAKRR